MQGVTPATLPPTDPLIRLGESLTLHVLTFLPLRDLLLVPRLSRAYASLYDAHSSGIFRPACRRFDIDSEQFQELQLVEMNDVTSSNTSGQHDHLDSDGPQDDVEPSRVDWKAALRDHVVWDGNWKAGVCVDRWINPSKRDVWRFKIDSEENCCIMTSRRGRVEVVDADGSTPLFAIEGLRPYAHLEFANGFAVFDNGLEPLQLEVWRNRHALARSLHPKPFGRTLSDHRPMMVEELLLPEDGSAADFATRWVTAEAPLTRGNLSFYRHISPPHPCRAFRARVDYKGTPDERSVICMAGDHGVYIYDLEEGSLVQHIKTNEAHDFCFNMTYVELDDQNVFLCTAAFFFAFSRQSHKLLLTLPPSRFDDSGEASVGISLRFDPGAHGMENGSSPVNGHHSAAASMANSVADDEEQIKPTRVRQCRPHAVRTGRAEPRHVMDPGDGQHHPFVRTAFGFEACHYAHGDLVYAGNGNRTFMTRRYESILKIAENDKRRDAWIDHTIALEIEDTESARFSNIATDRTHVVLASTDRALFLDTSTLPNMCSTTSACDCQSESGDVEVPIPELASSQPAGVNEAHHDAYVPPSASQPTANSSSHISADLAVLPTELPPGPVLHIIDSLERRGLSGMSCVQADKDNIYLTYDISHEGQTPRDPLMAILAAGRRRQDVIRCWNFAPAS